MKPSSRVIEILHGLQMENNSDIEIDFLRFHSVLQYLDEQAESQEPKASEECCSHCDDKGEPGYTECKDCPCHQKETEPKGMIGGSLLKEDYIILQRPKGWRIGQTIWNFKEWLRLTHEVKDFFYMTDDEWNRRWNEYLTSIKSQE